MTKLSAKMAARLKNYRSNLKSAGFSMLEAVVVVGVLLALAVSGFIAYGSITANAKKASVESAASSVYTAALAAEMDGDSATDPATVISDFNASQTSIEVAKAGSDKTLAVEARNIDSGKNGGTYISAHKGAATAVTFPVAP